MSSKKRKKKDRMAAPQIAEENFRENITTAIKEGSHAEYLQRVLGEYEWYCAEFAKVFSLNQLQDSVYAFHIVYKLKKGSFHYLRISVALRQNNTRTMTEISDKC